MEKWYVAHSKPKSEELLWKQYCLRNIEAYYPSIKVKTVNPRARQAQAYFPGYLFVHVDLGIVSRSMLEWLPGGSGLVSFGGEPAFLPDSLIHAIQENIEKMTGHSRPTPVLLNKGDHVFIHEGAFKGYEAIFDAQLSGFDRVRVLLSMLGDRQIPVELPASSIQLAS